ncbi:hypothetical protein COT48_05630 [Candidatus Woesearchaeota archaeon CG08_land_8_20_14_0_20_47_9]|nr:MAG: hypothetical protein COV22_04190 [Candidatus Woesearchaeota archaeon CG10_big_fil_rev_8_21_14_0_10_47_5]PIO03262.1 MAG: hypothetical protein COT48_05630 [Candidatus Woesearchaeota archaeon CG08_land_8_20_14_0_20_47_9]
MASRVVSNTWPLLHLTEIALIKTLEIFEEIHVPEEVKNELKKKKITLPKRVKLIPLKARFKDVTEILTDKFFLDLGEAQAIALALQERADYFLTDDLEARTVAKMYNLEAHGTVGLILRAFREKIINKDIAIKKVSELYTTSSLFITRDLIEFVIEKINGENFD